MFLEDSLLDAVLRGTVLTGAALLWVVVLSRGVGLRSFSKMTAFDFVATVASGSLLAAAGSATEWAQFVQSMAALLALFTLQVALAWSRHRWEPFRRMLDNAPTLLVRDGVISEEALRASRVARADVVAKMREANALRADDVRAVVLEATGDISVLHGGDVDPELMQGVESRSISQR